MRRLVALLLMLPAWPAVAMVYEARMDSARWELYKKPGECRLVQKIPDFGEAAFVSRPGERLAFTLTTIRPLPASGIAYLQAESVPWKPSAAPRPLSRTAAVSGKTSLVLGADAASEVLTALSEGWQARISRQGWFPGEQLSVVVSPVRMGDALSDFLRCKPRVPPAPAPAHEAGEAAKGATPDKPAANRPADQPEKAPVTAAAGAHAPTGKEPVKAAESAPKKELKPEPVPAAECPPVVNSPSQDRLKQREEKAGVHKQGTKTKQEKGLETMLMLAFPAGKSTMSKDVQDSLELVVADFQKRKSADRGISVKVEATGGAGLDELAKERVTLARGYLLKRGIPAARVHARVIPGKGSVDDGKVGLTIGD